MWACDWHGGRLHPAEIATCDPVEEPMTRNKSPNRNTPRRKSSTPGLRLVRLPGEFGPILRCFGDLSLPTVATLQRELDLLEPLDHRVLTVDLSGCEFVDVDGILTLLHSFKRRREGGHSLIVVAGPGPVARLLQVVGFDIIVPTFPSEESAMLASRGGGPPLPAPTTWAIAREDTLARWRLIREALDQASPSEVLRLLTSVTALCERSEELFQERSAPATFRCQFCPLFYALGGREEDVGCQSTLNPLIEAVRASNPDSARAQVATVIRTIEEMPLPEGGRPPGPSLP
jgi:anti-anti-sigma factor